MLGNVGKNISAANKLWQAQRKIKKIEAVGQGKAVSVLINGVYEVDEVEVDDAALMAELGIQDSTLAKKLANFLKKDIKKAMEDAKKNLEKQLKENTNLDDLKNLFS